MGIGRGLGISSVIVTLLFACGGTSNSGSGGGVTEDGFANGYCSAYTACCQKIGKSADMSTCLALFDSRGNEAQYDPALGGKCLSEINAAQSKPNFCDMNPSDTPSCDGVYTENGSSTGTKAPGEPCQSTSECAPSTEGTAGCESFFTNNAETRICQVRVDGKAGDTPCVGTKEGNVTSFSGTEDKPPPKGYICDVAKGVACNSKTLACEKIPAVGEACGTGFQFQCSNDGFCDFTSKKCVARIAVGGDCAAQSSGCVKEAFCDKTSKKCTAILADGAPCTSFEQCGSNASCTNGACKAFGGTGSLVLAFICGK